MEEIRIQKPSEKSIHSDGLNLNDSAEINFLLL